MRAQRTTKERHIPIWSTKRLQMRSLLFHTLNGLQVNSVQTILATRKCFIIVFGRYTVRILANIFLLVFQSSRNFNQKKNMLFVCE
jgi:hypothetical protein